jgi:hypothetical protein
MLLLIASIDGPLACEGVATNSSKVESVHLKPNNSLEIEVLQLATIQIQATC